MKIQTSSVVALSLLAGLVAATPKVLAEPAAEATKFPLPNSLPKDTTVKIGGSQSLDAVNKGLEEAFKKKFADSKVVPTYSSTSKGIEALTRGEAEIVGAGRPLTKEEQAKGLGSKDLGFKKIAIIVSDKNTFIPRQNPRLV
jgi:phosphate transport system substrate-binding protein